MKVVNPIDLKTIPIGEIVEVKVLNGVKKIRIALISELIPSLKTICQNCALHDYCDQGNSEADCESNNREDLNEVFYPKA